MRLPPSSAAWRIAACSRCGEPEAGGSARSSVFSRRSRQAAKGDSGIRLERFRRGRIGRIAEQAYAQFGLFKRLLAAAVEADATFVGGQRFFQAHFPLF